MPVSQNQWPGLSADSSRLHTWTVPERERQKTQLRLRNGSAGFLLVHLATWFDDRLEDLTGNYSGGLDDWAYAYRPVRGYATLSNHASGTAMDLNATDHPLGVNATFSRDEEALIQRRLRLYKGCIRWGGDYRGRKDEMHFEIAADLGKCERVARDLLRSPRGRRVIDANPGQERVIRS